MSSTEEVVASQLIGQVKWFSNIKNYGFISVVTPGDYHSQEIFVHQTQIKTDGYRTLRQGEYVSFDLSPNTSEGDSDNQSSSHKFIATNITGVLGGSLMCEQQRHYGGSDSQGQDEEKDGFSTYRRRNNRHRDRNGNHQHRGSRN
mgnify:CR=1 FL=1